MKLLKYIILFIFVINTPIPHGAMYKCHECKGKYIRRTGAICPFEDEHKELKCCHGYDAEVQGDFEYTYREIPE